MNHELTSSIISLITMSVIFKFFCYFLFCRLCCFCCYGDTAAVMTRRTYFTLRCDLFDWKQYVYIMNVSVASSTSCCWCHPWHSAPRHAEFSDVLRGRGMLGNLTPSREQNFMDESVHMCHVGGGGRGCFIVMLAPSPPNTTTGHQQQIPNQKLCVYVSYLCHIKPSKQHYRGD